MPANPTSTGSCPFSLPAFVHDLGPQVDITVRALMLDGAEQPGHLLAGAAVDLLDAPAFQSRNGLIAPGGNTS